MTERGYVSLNPVQVEQKLVGCVRDLYAAEKALAEARDASLVRQAYSMAGAS